MVLDKIRTNGLAATLKAVKNKLDQPLRLTLNASRSMLGKMVYGELPISKDWGNVARVPRAWHE